MHRSKKADSSNPDDRFHTLVLVTLTSRAYSNVQKTAGSLAKYKEVESVDIIAGNWDLALEVKTENQQELYYFLKRIISREEEIAKTESLISLKRIKPASS